jgi:hypothetical protein
VESTLIGLPINHGQENLKQLDTKNLGNACFARAGNFPGPQSRL